MARVYQTTSMAEATLHLGLVGNQSEADLCVHRVDTPGNATGDALWYITSDKKEATVLVRFTTINTAQIKVCLVDSLAEVGWQERGQPALRFRGKLG